MTKSVLLIGFGAMGRSVFDALRNCDEARITHILERPARIAELKKSIPGAHVVQSLEEVMDKPDVVVECAGHTALVSLVPALLKRGVTAIVASVGALATPGVPETLEQAARAGEGRLILIPGAMAGIDALAAAQPGLREVTYTGRKPPLAWLNTPAEQHVDLRVIDQRAVIFEGSAREAAQLYPRNANVAATVALAGIGLDRTRVVLQADPSVTRNTHCVHATGAFGDLVVEVSAAPLANNPKTSALAALSIVRAVRNDAGWRVL